jgi:hypothetical protein
MPKGPFLPYEFTPTKFSTTADKAEFGNHFLRFIESECAQALFTKRFYNRLSMCFSRIAHYNRSPCYEEWFSTSWVRMNVASASFGRTILPCLPARLPIKRRN